MSSHYRHTQRSSRSLKQKQGRLSNHFAILTSLRERVRCREVKQLAPSHSSRSQTQVPFRVVLFPWHYTAYQDMEHLRAHPRKISGVTYSPSLLSMGNWFQDPCIYQNLRMIKSLILNGVNTAGPLYLSSAFTDTA